MILSFVGRDAMGTIRSETDGAGSESETDGSGWTRREAMQTLGLAALVGTGGDGRAPASSAKRTVSGGRAGIVPVGKGAYDTIHEAIDAAAAGDTVRVLGSYDARAASEPFPIVLDYSDKPVALAGTHPSNSVIDAGNADADVVEVRGVGSDDYLNQPIVRSLRIRGGNVGLRVRGAPFATYRNLVFNETGSHGMLIDTYENPDGLPLGTFGTNVFGCQAWDCGGDGFTSVAGAASHATYYLGCRATGNRGNGFHLQGSSSKVVGGVSQLNHGYGISARQGNSITIGSTYVEGNGRSLSYPIGILAAGTTTTTVENCYLNGINPRSTPGHDYDSVQRAVNFYRVDTGAVENCTGRDYGDGIVAAVQSNDVDVSYPSHAAVETDVLATENPRDYGTTRPRSDGVILPTDLGDVEGAFEGDVGYHVGTDEEGPAYWRDGAWHLAATRTL